MSCFRIEGGRPLEGCLSVQGAKNSVLPILAAALLAPGESMIHNCPDLSDVSATLDILSLLGCRVEREEYRPGSKVHRGAHGYDPDCPGYETFFMAAGPDFQPGAEVAAMNLTDEGPTMARALGLELEDADGAVIDSFFRFAY